MTQEPVRTDFVDYPTAWRIQTEIGTTSPPHLYECSCVEKPGVTGVDRLAGPGLLCDCAWILVVWRQKVKEQTGVEPELYADHAARFAALDDNSKKVE